MHREVTSCDPIRQKGIAVNAGARTVAARPGVKWGKFDAVTGAENLATPGGGIGWLSRKYGLTCEDLVAAEVVTGNGSGPVRKPIPTCSGAFGAAAAISGWSRP